MTDEGTKQELRMSHEKLIDPDWFNALEKSTYWVRFYEFIMPSDMESIGEAIRDTELILPIKLTYGHVRDVSVKRFTQTISRQSRDAPEILLKVTEEVLPEGDYVILTCPFRVDTGHGGPMASTRTKFLLDCFAALFRTHLGMNALWRLVYEGERFAHNGIWASLEGPSIRWPQPAEGPHYGPDNWSGIMDAAKSITSRPAQEQQKLLLALRYLNRGCEDGDFINYWTGIEVLCGNAGKIRAKLWKAYGLKRQHDVDDLLQFNTIAQWRHDLVHEGKQKTLSAEVERYLQCLFVDLLRHALGLDHRGFGASLLQELNLDLANG